jgi:hypothetical protein
VTADELSGRSRPVPRQAPDPSTKDSTTRQ